MNFLYIDAFWDAKNSFEYYGSEYREGLELFSEKLKDRFDPNYSKIEENVKNLSDKSKTDDEILKECETIAKHLLERIVNFKDTIDNNLFENEEKRSREFASFFTLDMRSKYSFNGCFLKFLEETFPNLRFEDIADNPAIYYNIEVDVDRYGNPDLECFETRLDWDEYILEKISIKIGLEKTYILFAKYMYRHCSNLEDETFKGKTLSEYINNKYLLFEDEELLAIRRKDLDFPNLE